LESIDIAILQLVDGNLSLEQLIMTKKTMVRKELFFRIAELANAAINLEEKARFIALGEDLMETLLKVDGNLHAELNAEIQKELNMELNRLRTGQKSKDKDDGKELGRDKVYDQALQQWQQQISVNKTRGNPLVGPTLPILSGNNSMTDVMGRAMTRFPG
jgi:hypothetical protein